MTRIDVSLGHRSYPILVDAGLLAGVGPEIAALGLPSCAVVLTHPGLASRYGDVVARSLGDVGLRVRTVLVPAGERTKNLRTVARLYAAMVECGVDRKGLLVALGGGVVGDIGGFVAATFLRGIPFVQVPTTLLAQVDASIGGKTGVDLPTGKNLVGAFHQPRAVYLDPETLQSLPVRQLRAGLAEVIKYGIISDECLFERVSRTVPRLLRRDMSVLVPAIVRSCEIKSAVVSQDETEQGQRATLNFGHTVGHAIEVVTGYRRFLHGEAVSIGMVVASLIGECVGVTPADVTHRIGGILARSGLPTALPLDIPSDALLDAISRDKKAVANKVRYVLVPQIGHTVVTDAVPESALPAALDRARRPATWGVGDGADGA